MLFPFLLVVTYVLLRSLLGAWHVDEVIPFLRGILYWQVGFQPGQQPVVRGNLSHRNRQYLIASTYSALWLIAFGALYFWVNVVWFFVIFIVTITLILTFVVQLWWKPISQAAVNSGQNFALAFYAMMLGLRFKFTAPRWVQVAQANTTRTRVYWILMAVALSLIAIYSLVIHEISFFWIALWILSLGGCELFGMTIGIRPLWSHLHSDSWESDRLYWIGYVSNSVGSILVKYMEVILYYVLFVGLIVLIPPAAYVFIGFGVLYIGYFIVAEFLGWVNRFWHRSDRVNKRLFMGVLALIALLMVLCPIAVSLSIVRTSNANIGKAITATATVTPTPDYSKDYCTADGLAKMESSMMLHGKKIIGVYSIEPGLKDSDCAYRLFDSAAVLMPVASASGQNVLLVVQRGFDPNGKAHYDVLFGKHWLLTARDPKDVVRLYILNAEKNNSEDNLLFFTQELSRNDSGGNYHPVLASAS